MLSNRKGSSPSIGAEGDNAKPPAGIEEPDFSKPKEVLLESLLPSDKHKFNAAEYRRKENDMALISAHSRLLKLRADLKKCQQKVDGAQKAYDKARNIAQENAEQDADDLLLEPTPWNNYCKQLKVYFDREGHSNFKRTITDDDVEGMSEAEAKEIRTLSWWTCRQRKFKRRGELEQHRISLLDRLKFNWDPHSGPGPEKWLKNYSLLKEFKQKHGHANVPAKYAENNLGSWLKTQVTQYRNAQEGKLPALSAERIRLLEEIGISWGDKRVTTSWDDRFQTLLDYKRRFGNVNVPWQWKEHVALAQWVNSQRKKYKDLLEGKRNNLSEEQINRLTSIGFKWNTGGKGRYSEDPNGDQNNEMVIMDNSSTVHPDVNVPSVPPVAAGVAISGTASRTGMTANLPLTYIAHNGLSSGITQDEYTNYLGSLDGNNGHNRPMLGGMSQDTLPYAQHGLAQQNQQDLSMLAYAYQQLNQQMNFPNKLFDQNDGGNPFL
eukprot:CAMPEP_0201868892 /NCGR_PEP_ID=MMETSP0902-20130614/2603_1 /ASSEMBLY_ACC=CAM_ASM_000551 /TAXON_ID=420261 /ORGANISM="Thalassiosira antarctica, Strain CCMP982" /LENGTH=491 /DNA_ID=CAMNT_0048394293 /DNA_START=32 /DNA_END=1507 /DNA_ORIENTATION=-